MNPFLNTLKDFEYESLESYLNRVGHANGSQGSGIEWANGLEKQPYFQKQRFNFLRNHEEMDIISQLTGRSRKDIDKLTIHYFVRKIGIPWVGGALKREFLDLPAKYCPVCIQEQPYQRIYWMFKSIQVCLKHSMFLTENCPVCQRKQQVANLVTGRCLCGASLSNHVKPSEIDLFFINNYYTKVTSSIFFNHLESHFHLKRDCQHNLTIKSRLLNM